MAPGTVKRSVEMNLQNSSAITFIVSVSVIQILGVLSMVLVGVWMGKYRGGFAWDGTGQEFNYHPLCMIIAFVFLNSEAMIIYRVFRHENKFLVKVVHFLLQLTAFCVAVWGLKAVFDFHNHSDIPNLYTLHSWLGIGTVVLFSLQLLCGFISFLYPKLPDEPRAIYMKVHVFFGVFIFLLAIGTCLTGMTEKLLFSIKSTYPNFVPEGMLANTLGITLVVLAGIVVFVVTNSEFKGRNVADHEQVALIQDKD